VICLPSCHEEKDPALSFSFGNLNPDQIVWNSTAIDFLTPSSLNGTIEVKIDGKTIGKIAESPYKINWDTRTQ